MGVFSRGGHSTCRCVAGTGTPSPPPRLCCVGLSLSHSAQAKDSETETEPPALSAALQAQRTTALQVEHALCVFVALCVSVSLTLSFSLLHCRRKTVRQSPRQSPRQSAAAEARLLLSIRTVSFLTRHRTMRRREVQPLSLSFSLSLFLSPPVSLSPRLPVSLT